MDLQGWICSILRAVLRFGLLVSILRICSKDLETQACHKTTIIIQNGTWLNTTKWLQNGFFGDQPIDDSDDVTTNLTTPEQNQVDQIRQQSEAQNPVLPLFPKIPNKKQDCLCGRLSKSTWSSDEGKKLSGGDKEKEKDFRPWLAKITVGRGSNSINCTGSLINAKFVLTASDCFCNDKTGFNCEEETLNLVDKDVYAEIGFMMGSEESQATVEADQVSLHTDHNLALLRFTWPVNNNGLIQPICLPPESGNNNNNAKDLVIDLDCSYSTSENPFPFYKLGEKQTNKVCNGKSMISGFTYKSNGNNGKCKTNGFGPADKGTDCMENCSAEEIPEQPQECNQILEDMAALSGTENFGRFDFEETQCYPNPVNNRTWCKVCDDCDEKWGFCSEDCGPTDGDSGQAGFYEAIIETYAKNPSALNECPMSDDGNEFCSGSGGMLVAKLKKEDDKYVIESQEMLAMGNAGETDQICFGDLGGPVWKRSIFTSPGHRGSELDTLTGITFKHTSGCNSGGKFQNQVSIHTRLLPPAPDGDHHILEWIYEKSDEGKCTINQNVVDANKNDFARKVDVKVEKVEPNEMPLTNRDIDQQNQLENDVADLMPLKNRDSIKEQNKLEQDVDDLSGALG